VATCSTQVPPLIENGGGENSFLGRTRCEDNREHGRLVLLRYEAKQSMALKELDKVFAASLASRSPYAIPCWHA
jgi:molybdopterin synthase catalytic subunit